MGPQVYTKVNIHEVAFLGLVYITAEMLLTSQSTTPCTQVMCAYREQLYSLKKPLICGNSLASLFVGPVLLVGRSFAGTP
jgi:hypothetical protein